MPNDSDRTSLFQFFNPFNPATQAMELKYQYFNRPSTYASAGLHGLQWRGLWGFRTIVGGAQGSTRMFGTGGNPGQIAKFVENTVNRSAAAVIRKSSSAFASLNQSFSGFMNQWASGIQSGRGIIGGIESASSGTTSKVFGVVRQILGGTDKGFFRIDANKALRDVFGRGGIPMRGHRGFFELGDISERLTKDIGRIVDDIGPLRGWTKGGAGAFRKAFKEKLLKGAVVSRMRGKEAGALAKILTSKFTTARLLLPSIASGVSLLGNLWLAGSIMVNLSSWATQGVVDIAKRAPSLDMGSDTFGGQLGPSFTNNMASTMRQRALQEMRGSVIGTRSLLGNEAALYAD